MSADDQKDIVADFNEEVAMAKKVMNEEGINSSECNELIDEARKGLKENK